MTFRLISANYEPDETPLLAFEEHARGFRRTSALRWEDFVACSSAMGTLLEQLQQAAAESGPVLIRGEPGAGVNTAARAVHLLGPRADRAFLRIDCRLLASDALEQELFGVPRSAEHAPSSGGHWEAARGGTLFLDAIEELPVLLQRRVARLAASGSAVRLIAGSHAAAGDPARSHGIHRELLDALARTTIEVPPLRKRLDELGLLAECLLHRLAVREGRPIRRLGSDALALLAAHAWPGNVRELENVLERATATAAGDVLTADLVRPWLVCSDSARAEYECDPTLTLREMERKLIETAFARCGGNRERTAKELGIGIRTLCGKLRDYGYPPRGGPGSNRVHDAPAPQLRAA